MTQEVRLTVNGKLYDLEVAADRLVIDLLREDLGLTGTKEYCGIGVCGVCTVWLDGEMATSCLLLAVIADGREITTIEGLADNGDLDSVQQAFVEYGGVQCGICTPGQIMAARALLNEIPSPSETQVKEWMKGNLCRCTGYYKIIESVLAGVGAERPKARRKSASD